MRRVLLLVGVLAALGASLASPVVAADAALAATERLPALDRQVLSALNKTRADHGLRPVVMSNALNGAAVAHSRAMLERGFFAHDSPNGAPFAARVRGFYRSAGYTRWSVGENLIYNTGEITAEIAIAAWLASPGHRENMLTPEWREVGIGSLHAPSASGVFAGEPTWVITMDFGVRVGKVTERTVARKLAMKTKTEPRNAADGKASKISLRKQKAKAGKSAAKKTLARSARAKDTHARPIDRVLPRPFLDSDDEGDTASPAHDPTAAPNDDPFEP